METLDLGCVLGVGMTYINKAGIAPAPPGTKPNGVEADVWFLRRPTEGREGGSRRKRGIEGEWGKEGGGVIFCRSVWCFCFRSRSHEYEFFVFAMATGDGGPEELA